MADLQILKRGLLVESSGPCVCVVAPNQVELGSGYELIMQQQAVEIVPLPPTQTIEMGLGYELIMQQQAVQIVPLPPTLNIEVGDDYIMTP